MTKISQTIHHHTDRILQQNEIYRVTEAFLDSNRTKLKRALVDEKAWTTTYYDFEKHIYIRKHATSWKTSFPFSLTSQEIIDELERSWHILKQDIQEKDKNYFTMQENDISIQILGSDIEEALPKKDGENIVDIIVTSEHCYLRKMKPYDKFIDIDFIVRPTEEELACILTTLPQLD